MASNFSDRKNSFVKRKIRFSVSLSHNFLLASTLVWLCLLPLFVGAYVSSRLGLFLLINVCLSGLVKIQTKGHAA